MTKALQLCKSRICYCYCYFFPCLSFSLSLSCAFRVFQRISLKLTEDICICECPSYTSRSNLCIHIRCMDDCVISEAEIKSRSHGWRMYLCMCIAHLVWLTCPIFIDVCQSVRVCDNAIWRHWLREKENASSGFDIICDLLKTGSAGEQNQNSNFGMLILSSKTKIYSFFVVKLIECQPWLLSWLMQLLA